MLLHFTKSMEALSSITSNGFLYLHNETGVLGPAARDAFGIDAADTQSSGMICFTELSESEISGHQDKYGKFGAGISKAWLVANGAGKVNYVQIGGPIYTSFVERLKSLAPKTLYGISTQEYLANPDTRFNGTQALTSPKWASVVGASEEFVSLLESLEWTQIDRDAAEREWRIRNPKPYAFKGRPSRQEAVALLVNCILDPNIPDQVEGVMLYTINGKHQLMCPGKSSLALRLPAEQIQALFCPHDHRPVVDTALGEAGANHIRVVAGH